MWISRKLPLSVLIFTVVFYKVTSGSSQPLGMALDAVDDLYEGCRDEAMTKFIESDVLKQELDQNAGFRQAWSENSNCAKLISGGMKEHIHALSALANGNRDFVNAFNSAVKMKGTNESTYETFNFKALHFLLIDAMKLSEKLNAKQCRTVYYLTESTSTAKINSKVRLGGFTIAFKSYALLKRMEEWDGRSIFNITTCFFFDLGKDSCSQDTDMILLSPAEEYTVKYTNIVDDTDNEESYTEIVLEQPELKNLHNCYIFSRSPAIVSALWLVLVLAILPSLL